MAQLNFNAANVAPDTGIDPVPAGWYNVMMTESEQKPTKAGNGDWYLSCTYKILDGQFAGRSLFTNMNLKNSNPTAQEIAHKQLSAICHAIGVMQVNDSAELHGKPLKIKVKIRIDKTGEYEPQNEITGYDNINAVKQAAAGAAPAQQAPAGFGQVPAQGGMPVQQPWQNPQQQMQPAQQFQQPMQGGMVQGMAQPQQQMPLQQPQQQYQQPAQQPQQQVQYQQPAQQQQPQQQQQAPANAPAQPWEQGAAQPWAQPNPQQMQQVAQAPQQMQQMQQPAQQQQPAMQNPVVQQFANATPPWQQGAAQ